MRSRAICSKCGADVEALTYCGVCGASLRGSAPAPEPGSRGRFERTRGIKPVGFWGLTLGLGVVALLVALLTGFPGIAIVIAAAATSLLVVIRLTRVDVFEREPVRVWYVAGIAGFVAGAIIAIADAFVIERFWFEGATFHAGAAGFAGEVARDAGAPPVIVLVLGGIVLPLAGLATQLTVPLLLRRFPSMRNEVVDGVILGAAAGSGFATATAIVYFWPLITEGRTAIDVADGTAQILGVVLVRPVLFALFGGLVGAGIWRSALTTRTGDLVMPLASGLSGLFVYAVVERLLMPFGSIVELGWLLLVTAVLGVVGRRELHRAVRYDRQQLVVGGGRTVCPHCRSVTPAGEFCAACGERLVAGAGADATSPRTPSVGIPADEPVGPETGNPGKLEES